MSTARVGSFSRTKGFLQWNRPGLLFCLQLAALLPPNKATNPICRRCSENSEADDASAKPCASKKCAFVLCVAGATTKWSWRTTSSAKFSKSSWRKRAAHTSPKSFTNFTATHRTTWKEISTRLSPGAASGHLRLKPTVESRYFFVGGGGPCDVFVGNAGLVRLLALVQWTKPWWLIFTRLFGKISFLREKSGFFYAFFAFPSFVYMKASFMYWARLYKQENLPFIIHRSNNFGFIVSYFG